jgi:hypothetical protein
VTPARRPYELTGGEDHGSEPPDDGLGVFRGYLWVLGPSLLLWAAGIALILLVAHACSG